MISPVPAPGGAAPIVSLVDVTKTYMMGKLEVPALRGVSLDIHPGERIDLMKELNREEGTTFIFSTHDARVMSHASAVVRLADGKLLERVQQGGEAPVAKLEAHG